MRFFKLLFLVLLISTGCDRDPFETISTANLRGEYVGTFERNGETANVELQFNNRQYTGSSEVQKFPAICKGEYTLKSNVIVFSNICPWTAEFDWTLILDGEWSYDLSGDTLILIAANGDKYNLTKK